MAEVTKVTETGSQGLEPVNPKLISQYDQLLALLASRLTADHAFLLAEPMPLGGAKESGKDTAWYVKGDGTVRALSSLPSDQAASIEHRVAVLVYDIRNLATELISDGGASRELGRLLQDALVFPDTAQVFLVDDRPVLVNWGYRKQAGTPGVGVAGGTLSGIGRARSTPERAVTIDSVAATGLPSGTASGATSSATVPVLEQQNQPEPGVRRRFSGRWLAAAALWSVFVVISGMLGLRLIDACALGPSKWPAFIRSLAPNHCAVRNSPDLQAINDAARTLEASIRQKQLIIAAKLAKCEVECSPPLPRPKPHVETDGDKARKIVTERGGKTGRLQVTLAWHTFDDLDLEIVCPLGMLAQSRYKQKAPGNCGDGKIDVDANRKMLNPVINPVENAVWENDIPELLYVRVDAYLIKSASPVDYIVTVKLDR